MIKGIVNQLETLVLVSSSTGLLETEWSLHGLTPASRHAARMNPGRSAEWLREASSGTTPPCRRWMAIWEEMMEESISGAFPSPAERRMATAVSSQEDSIPRTVRDSGMAEKRGS